MTKCPEITIPSVGLGLWKVDSNEQFLDTFKTAIDVGYRHFDSAQMYHNEHLLGEAWQLCGLKRSDLFITTKVSIASYGSSRTIRSVENSLKLLQTEYINLVLLHFPVPFFRKHAWLALEQLKKSGRVEHIGVSNYTIRHLEQMKKYATCFPEVNQIELHVFLQQPELVDYCQRHKIKIEAYSPLAHAKNMDNPIINQIAKKHQKSYAQIMLRWCLEKGFIILPKSVTPSRITENFDVSGFSLDESDMHQLAQLDSNLRTCWNPTFVP